MRQFVVLTRVRSMRRLAESPGPSSHFADPHSPWQRGIDENTNGQLRQYLPKGTDLNHYAPRQLDHIAWRLNTQPGTSRGFRTPADVLSNPCFTRTA